MGTIRDVAKLAGVSVATVSRVINQRGYVHKDTEEKIRTAMEELEFVPNPVARGLASKDSKTLALIVPDITNPFFPELARAVEDTAARLGYTVILGNSDGNEEKLLHYVQNLKKRYVDGIILASHQRLPEFLGIPVVCVDRAASTDDFPNVRVNDYEGGRMATQHLLSIGCRNIAHISGPMNLLPSFDRLRGFMDVLEGSSLYRAEYIAEGNFATESAIHLTHELLIGNPEIDGIFTANDLMAVGALKACLRLGKKVPEDVAVIGFDGIELCKMIEPELSTIAQPIYKIGELAVEQLIHQIVHGTGFSEKTNNLPVALIQRASTKKTF